MRASDHCIGERQPSRPTGSRLLLGRDFRIAHPDFFAVVNEGRAAQRQQHHRRDAGARVSVATARVARDMAREIVIRQRPGRPRAGSEGFFSQLDCGAEAARVVAREQKAEVERELKFVGPQIVGQPFLLARPRLADQHPIFVTVA